MFLEKASLEEILELTERRIKEAECRAADIDRLSAELFDELKVTPEQVSRFLSNPNNFTHKNWLQIKEQTRLQDEKLTRELDAIRNPKLNKKKYAGRQVQSHWLYVR